jgi:hypothetical protein
MSSKIFLCKRLLELVRPPGRPNGWTYLLRSTVIKLALMITESSADGRIQRCSVITLALVITEISVGGRTPVMLRDHVRVRITEIRSASTRSSCRDHGTVMITEDWAARAGRVPGGEALEADRGWLRGLGWLRYGGRSGLAEVRRAVWAGRDTVRGLGWLRYGGRSGLAEVRRAVWAG